MALMVENGPQPNGPGSRATQLFVSLCQLPGERSSSPPASWSWDKGLVLLPKPLTPQSGQREKGWVSLRLLGGLACRAQRQVRNRRLIAEPGTYKIPCMKV